MIARTIAPRDEGELSAYLAERSATGQALRIAGGGTRVETGGVAAQDCLTTGALTGVISYEPSEMVLIARAGTPLSDIEPLLAEAGQSLAFEPPDMRRALGREGEPTVGGMVAANASGPRRIQAGACRDHLLGMRFVDGQGRIIRNGGRVMKNVTGLDLGKLLCGAHATLGVLTEVALKTLPTAPAQATLAFPDTDADEALRIFTAALATPFEVSGAAFHARTAWLRVEGLPAQVHYRCERLRGLLRDREIEMIPADDSRSLWRNLRDLDHLADRVLPLWRLLLKPTDAPAVCRVLEGFGGTTSIDWGGGLVWYCGPADAATVRAAAAVGHATLIRRADLPGPAFPPQAEAVEALSAALRRRFDPAGILNPGLMEA